MRTTADPRNDLRRRAAAARAIPLTTVLTYRGATRDPSDRSKWRTERGPVSITGSKFMNWTLARGGGGAIDLVMQLAQLEFLPALEWLEHPLGTTLVAAPIIARASSSSSGADHCSSFSRDTSSSVTLGDSSSSSPDDSSRRASSGLLRSSRTLRLPPRDDRHLDRVRQYLLGERGLPARLIDPLIEAGKIFADGRSNAVFPLVAGKLERAVGAELRGTGPGVWRGLAPGTDKDAGYFWIGRVGSRQIVICESAIDALSCHALFPERICVSTAGVRSNPRWLSGLLSRGYEISCGYDADAAGDEQASAMRELHPSVLRLRPSSHDWNDVLRNSR
jgi:hypothetical protein